MVGVRREPMTTPAPGAHPSTETHAMSSLLLGTPEGQPVKQINRAPKPVPLAERGVPRSLLSKFRDRRMLVVELSKPGKFKRFIAYSDGPALEALNAVMAALDGTGYKTLLLNPYRIAEDDVHYFLPHESTVCLFEMVAYYSEP